MGGNDFILRKEAFMNKGLKLINERANQKDGLTKARVDIDNKIANYFKGGNKPADDGPHSESSKFGPA